MFYEKKKYAFTLSCGFDNKLYHMSLSLYDLHTIPKSIWTAYNYWKFPVEGPCQEINVLHFYQGPLNSAWSSFWSSSLVGKFDSLVSKMFLFT